MIEIDPARRDALAVQQFDELAPSAANVEHLSGEDGKKRQVELLPGPDRITRAAKLVLEAEVFVSVK